MTDFEIETIRRLREHADNADNYAAGWDVIVEAYTAAELLELFNGDDDATYATMVYLFGEEYSRLEPPTTYEEAFQRVENVVKLLEEQRQAVITEIF
jgi:hypothetical protein